jgi:prepilin peptidase dependent protein B
MSTRTQSGLSLVELMVGLALALLLLAGVMKAFAGQIEHTRRLLLEARVQQDLRGATELIARDLRRAGHWQAPWSAPKGMPNPYGDIELLDGEEVHYAYSQDTDGENHAVDSREQHGFRIEGGVLKAADGDAGWQPVTDPAVVTVTALDIAVQRAVQPLGHLCTPVCAASDPTCPAVEVREVEVRMQAHATADPALAREARERVRVRNDRVTAACP